MLCCFRLFTDSKQHKACQLDMITLRNHAPWSYMTWWRYIFISYPWPWECYWHDYCILYSLMTSQALISKIHCTCTLSASEKKDSMYHNGQSRYVGEMVVHVVGSFRSEVGYVLCTLILNWVMLLEKKTLFIIIIIKTIHFKFKLFMMYILYSY